jgi:hypothetical protein
MLLDKVPPNTSPIPQIAIITRAVPKPLNDNNTIERASLSTIPYSLLFALISIPFVKSIVDTIFSTPFVKP